MATLPEGKEKNHPIVYNIAATMEGRKTATNEAANQARLQWFALAYQPGNFLRRLAQPQSVRPKLSPPIGLPPVIARLADQVDQDRSERVQACSLPVVPNGGVFYTRDSLAAILRRIRRLIQAVPV